MSRSFPTEDRISTLPDQILCHILSFLPTKFAATASVLSKRWNPLWISVETLHFDDQDFEIEATFRDFVSCVFLLRDIMLPLRSFHLKYSDTRSFYQRDLSRFIHAAVQRREIENLNLNMPYSYYFNLKLPPSIFSCKTLVDLRLTGIQLHDLSHVVMDLPRLKTLHFSTHQINIPLYFSPKPFQRFDYLSKLLIGCPAIEEFHAPLVWILWLWNLLWFTYFHLHLRYFIFFLDWFLTNLYHIRTRNTWIWTTKFLWIAI
jgi:Leucine-rich repeat (LRR) protein